MLTNHKTEAFSDVKGISFPNPALEFALSEKRLYIFCAPTRVFCSRNCQAGRHGGGTHEEELRPHCEHHRTLAVNAERVGSSSALLGLLTVAAIAAALEINRAPEPVLHRCPARDAERAA
jgi:hypothetical protein